MNSENFVCLNCLHVGSLDANLRCTKCNSDSVLSQERAQRIASGSNAKHEADTQLAREHKTARNATLYAVRCGPFRAVALAHSRQEALHECISETKPWYLHVDTLTFDGQELEQASYFRWWLEGYTNSGQSFPVEVSVVDRTKLQRLFNEQASEKGATR